jgi:hypothetical protein
MESIGWSIIYYLHVCTDTLNLSWSPIVTRLVPLSDSSLAARVWMYRVWVFYLYIGHAS